MNHFFLSSLSAPNVHVYCTLTWLLFQSHDILEFIPLINQLITKYKERIAPFLDAVFVSVVQTINKCLNEPCDPLDMEVRGQDSVTMVPIS